jgi:copper chaperone NosL
MKKKFSILLALYVLVALMTACAPQSTDIQPPDIIYGQDMCDECGMLISEPQFAAALILEDGTPLKFDDAGEIFQYAAQNPDMAIKAWFVHDYNTEAWLNAEAAYFVVVPGLASPMGYGVAAFELQADAQSFADDQNAEVLTFADVRSNPPTGRTMEMGQSR